MPAFTPGRYRWRTRLRMRLPGRIAHRVSKGHIDCGNHEWYNADNRVDHCYHCQAEREHTGPIET